MTFALGRALGTSSSVTADQSSATLTTTAIANADELVVLRYAVDNFQTSDGDEVAVTSVSDTAGNTWVKAVETTNGQGGAQAGATCGIWYSDITTAIPSGGIITVNFSHNTSRDAAALAADAFTKTAGTVPQVRGTATRQDDNTGTAGSLNVVVSPSEAYLRLRASAVESNGSGAFTATSGYTVLAQSIADSGTALTSMGLRGEFHATTLNTDFSSPTGGPTFSDWASVYVLFSEAVSDKLGASNLAAQAATLAGAGTNTTDPYEAVRVRLYPGRANPSDVTLRAGPRETVTGPAALAAAAASLAGAGISKSTGTGALAAAAASLSGAGTDKTTGTGALAAQAATLSGAGVSKWVGTGTFADQAATLAGAGISKSTGTGALSDQAASVSGAGISKSTGTGALAAAAATLSGAGISKSTGAGALVAQAATVSGAGISKSIGTGALVDQSASLVGAGVTESVGSGVLADQAAVIAGAGVDGSAGTGVLADQAAAIAGSGESQSIGAGALAASDAAIAGTGQARSADSGVLEAQRATLAGIGRVLSEGTGAILVGEAAIAGAGELSWSAFGALVAAGAGLAGVGTVRSSGRLDRQRLDGLLDDAAVLEGRLGLVRLDGKLDRTAG
jgi:hypothetical protein